MRLTTEQQDQVIANLDIAETVAARIFRRHTLPAIMSTWDMRAAAYYGLCRAVLMQYPGSKFPAFARMVCRQQIYRDFERLYQFRIGSHFVEEQSWLDLMIVEHPGSELEQLEEAERFRGQLDWLIGGLSQRQRQVCNLRLSGMRDCDIARRLGISREMSGKHYMLAIERLRASMASANPKPRRQ